ncbi:Penicillin-binding protein 1F [Corynebacterium auriscanis]|uniref:Penicillin-binding protein n=2 Tax=Corynebacterium auriscanis TaxID=99807 RepID=A0A0A2DHV0_9CORY|nr:transglycosylase domain-containing protein [Corynebacterium auriscanis]KGM18785.1 penicillin-binding protein [Corynebacterium auriscanis]WJY73718.1 Penicillin-binding protein 1F [Corynebacterium auriscanis]
MNTSTSLAKMFAAIVVGGLLLALAMVPFAGLSGWAVSATNKTMNSNVQDISANDDLPRMSNITDRYGNTMAYIYDQRRIEVKPDEISQNMKNAIVAIEDRRFFEHAGVDIKGTLRAAAANVTSGGVSEGASTLNQQYVKNYLLLVKAESSEQQAAAIETSIPRKLREMKMASELDKEFSKDEILTRYLNLVSFGNNSFGVQTAARTYFGTNAKDLTIPQAALLAGIVQSTSRHDPFTNPDGALARRNAVLDAMASTGKISATNAARYKKQGLGVGKEPKGDTNGCIGAGNAGFFCDYVLQWLDSKGIDRDKVAKGGLTVRTTLDKKAQEAADKASKNHVSATQTGVASVSNFISPTGNGHEVVAMASSRNYGLDTKKKETVLPITHSLQGHGAGSVFKIFAAAKAIEQGAGLNTVLDVPNRVDVDNMGSGGAKNCPPSKYCVENATSYKPTMTLKEALATSPNTPFITMAEKAGVKGIVDLAVKMGLRSYDDKGSHGDTSIAKYTKDNNLGSFVLGPNAVNPLELSNVAATLADHGRWCEPRPVLSVTDHAGNEVPLGKSNCEQALNKNVADALSNGMGSDISSGTAAGAAASVGWSGPIAAKTGTTETSFSAAFMGFTPQWAGSTYIFNDGGSSQNLCTSPVRQCGEGNLYGGNEPAQTFLEASKTGVAARGGPGLPKYDPKYNTGTNPEKFASKNAGASSQGQASAQPQRRNGPSQGPATPPGLQDFENQINDLLNRLQSFGDQAAGGRPSRR